MSDREFERENTPVYGIELDYGDDDEPASSSGRQSGSVYAAPGGYGTGIGPVVSWPSLLLHAALPLGLALLVAFLVNHQLSLVLQESVRRVRLTGWTPDLATSATLAGWDTRLWFFWICLMLVLIVAAAVAAQGVRAFDRYGIVPIGLVAVLLAGAAIGVLDLPGLLLPLFPAPDHAPDAELLRSSLPDGVSWWVLVAAVVLGMVSAWRGGDWAAWGAVIAAGAAATLIADVRGDEWVLFLRETMQSATGQEMLRTNAAQAFTEGQGRAAPLLWVRSISDLLVFLTPWWAFRMSVR